MSLSTVPVTNYTTDDGITTDDLNNIGQNIQDLEDSKYQETDDLTTDTANITTANITTLNMLGAVNPRTSPTAASQVVSAGLNWVPTRGLYIVAFDGVSLKIQINVSGWKDVAGVTIGGAFPTDGSNVRINNPTGGDLTAYYLKF